MKYIIQELVRYETKKDGTPFVTKNGTPFTQVKIKTTFNDYDVWASGADFDSFTKDWKAGDSVELEIFQDGEYQGYPQYKWKKPSPIPQMLKLLEEHEKRISALEARRVGTKVATTNTATASAAPASEEEVDVNNLPF